MFVIALDPGHGGDDPGALGPNGLKESEMSLDVVLRIRDLLELTDRRFKLCLTREGDEYISLSRRAEIANTINADLFVSYHFNWSDNPNVRGWEVFTTKGNTDADEMADALAEMQETVFPNQRVRSDFKDGDVDKEANFSVLRNTKCPAVLVEGEFISSPQGEDFIKSKVNRQKMAYAVACAICMNFGIEISEVPKLHNSNNEDLLTITQRVQRIEDHLGI